MKMVDPVDGSHIKCMWLDCEKAGKTEHLIVVREPYGVDPRNIIRPAPNMDERWKNVHYLFCCYRHREYWRHSHVSMFDLPSGSRGTIL
jgi:hypothetical protein